MDDLSQYADPLTIEVLKRVLPSNELQPKLTSIKWSTEIVVSIELPAPLGAEYSFSIYLLPEKQIHAELVGVESVSSKDFWYMPFEDAAFNNSVEKLDRAFAST